MTPEQVLSNKPKVLTQKQRESYFEKGYLLVENAIPKDWLERMRAVTNEMVDRSRSVVGPHKADQGHGVALRQETQHVIGAALGPSVERIGQHLGQKENIHDPCIRSAMATVRKRICRSSSGAMWRT